MVSLLPASNFPRCSGQPAVSQTPHPPAGHRARAAGCVRCVMQGLTRRDGFFENRDELHSFPRLPLFSPTLSVAAQRPQRIIFLPRSSVVVRHRTGSVGDTGGGGSPVFVRLIFTRMLREMLTASAQSHVSSLHRRPFASCATGRERAARFSPAEGYHAVTPKNVLPSGTAGHHIILSQYTEISFHVIFHTWCNSN